MVKIDSLGPPPEILMQMLQGLKICISNILTDVAKTAGPLNNTASNTGLKESAQIKFQGVKLIKNMF